GCPRIYESSIGVSEDIVFDVSIPTVDDIGYGLQPRRTVLDKILVDAAVAAGAELREHFTIRGLEIEDGSVVGVRSDQGVERARIVIGADGKNSFVARTVGAKTYDERPGVSFWYYTYFSGAPRAQRVFMGDGFGGSYGVTNDGNVCVMAGGSKRHFEEFRSDIEGSFYATLDRIDPEIAAFVRQGTREEKFYGVADLPGFFRVPYGPGWVLIGDAGFHKDPITASGITEAWLQAEWIADGLDDHFQGRRAFDEIMSEFQKHRDDHSRDWYEFTMRIAAVEPPSERSLQLFRALRQNRAAADRFNMVMAGLKPIGEFLSPDNIAKVFAGE
ncbi:MAG TPA: FAD-dependent monooxygenase, partial [Actinomycetota bacterium]|nr:FAD-dependent monooxygenase [Actinomycetota bacterium]